MLILINDKENKVHHRYKTFAPLNKNKQSDIKDKRYFTLVLICTTFYSAYYAD